VKSKYQGLIANSVIARSTRPVVPSPTGVPKFGRSTMGCSGNHSAF